MSAVERNIPNRLDFLSERNARARRPLCLQGRPTVDRRKLLVSLVLSMLLTGCAERSSSEITVGAIVPLTGDNAVYGVALKNGMDLARDEVNSRGGVHGKPLRILFEDDQADPRQGVTAFTKLASVNKVPMVIGAMFSAVTLAIAPLANRDHIVLLSPTSSAVELTNAGPYFFRIYPSDAYDGTFLADFASNVLRAKTAAILGIQVMSVAEVVNVFKARYEQNGGRVVDEESYLQGDTDFRTQLSKMKRSKPDVIFLPGYLREMAIQLKQASELGIKKPILSISTLYDPKIFDLAGDAADGVMFSTPYFDPESKDPTVRRFVKSFVGKYAEKPNIWAAYGYDAVNLSSVALDRAGINPNVIKDELHKIKAFPGVTGATTFDHNGDVIKVLTILKVVDHNFVVY